MLISLSHCYASIWSACLIHPSQKNLYQYILQLLRTMKTETKARVKTTPAKANFHSEYSQYEPAGLGGRRTRPEIFPASLDTISAIADAAPVDVMKVSCNVTAWNNTGVKSLVWAGTWLHWIIIVSFWKQSAFSVCSLSIHLYSITTSTHWDPFRHLFCRTGETE